MERRVFLAVVLCFVVLYAYQALFVPTPPPGTTSTAPSPEPAPAAQPPATAVATAPPVSPARTDDAAAAPAPVTAESSERQITVDSPALTAVFSNRGARLVSWRLKQYRDENGNAVDLVPSSLPPEQPTPFSLQVDDPQLTQRLNSAIYRVSGDQNGQLTAADAGATLVFDYEDASGLKARKEFRIDPRNYQITFSTQVSRDGQTLNPAVMWGPGLGDIGAQSSGGSFFTGNYRQAPQAIFHRNDEVERIDPGTLQGQPTQEGQFRFAGVDDHYFIATAVNPGQARLTYAPLTVPGDAGAVRALVGYTIAFAQAPQNVTFFFGPKQFDLLRSIDAELVRAIDFGIFGWLAVPLLGALQWLYGYIGNYGWAIVLLTIGINLAIFPLRHKSVVSMRKMQELQPQMKAIQDRYAGLKVTDPARQKMNTEIMNLYREKGVNPASGCIPMLLTLPVLFAFYSLLTQSIELRGAEFIGWIRDLSQPDPYFVIPAVMVATMFWQQKITPTTMDPAQQRVMLMMPLIFGVMLAWTASGTALYWSVSNLWAIGQQYATNRLIGPPQIQTIRPAAERRLKNAGSGRSTGADKRA
jgi:YidC/Oxa1 family membrane protein insertase